MHLSPEKKRLFAERLEKACTSKYGKRYGSASKLAADMDVSVQTAARWLRGDASPESHRWGEIASKLDVTAQWLIGATHDEPSSITDQLGDEGLEYATSAAKIVFPLVLRLKPDASKDEITPLIRHAYQQLRAGETEKSVSGEIAAILLN